MNFLTNLLPKPQPAQTEPPNKAKFLIMSLAIPVLETDKIPPMVKPILIQYLEALSNEDSASICDFIIQLGKDLDAQLNKNEIVGHLTGLDK